jgi:tetratricopeptide (TPR) repeat protein
MPSTFYTLPGQTPGVETKGQKALRWLITHRAQIGLAVGVAALAGGLAVAIVANRKKLTDAGVLQLTAARYKANQGQLKEAYQNIDDVLKTQRTNPVAMQGFILKGELLFQEKKFDEAEKNYAEGLRQTTSPDYRALMRAGRAAALVELKKFPEAVAEYESLTRDFSGHYLVPRWMMETGRLHGAQSQWVQAQAVFERLLTLYPKSSWAAEAQSNLNFVKSQMPTAPVSEK